MRSPYFSIDITFSLTDPFTFIYFKDFPAKTTARERQLLGIFLAGARDKEIAESLGISPGTVRAHLKHLFKKDGCP